MFPKDHLICSIFPEIPSTNRSEILGSLKKNQGKITFSHKINGRWENQYLDIQFVPQARDIFKMASELSKELTSESVLVPHKELGYPLNEFWFNVTVPGESTGWHDHKKNAVISGVYYLHIPENSGDLVLRKKENGKWLEWIIKSETGKMILFPSHLEHSVQCNRSKEKRISLSFNLYTLPLKLLTESMQYSTRKFFS